MKAIIHTTYGSPEILELKEIDKPVPKDHELLVRVGAASVNPLDWHLLRGEPFLIRLMGFGLLKPKYAVPGADFAGRIEAVGKDVEHFKTGNEIFGSGMGSFSDYLCVRENQAVLKPASLTLEQAAAVPVAALTALQALRNHGGIKAGKQVLINGASGGVGTFAVQIARAMGAHVTGVCSERNIDLVRSLGAEHVVDYTNEDFCESDKRYDLIVDNAGSQPIRRVLRVLEESGVYVGVGGSSSSVGVLFSQLFNPVIAKIMGRRAVSFMSNVNQADLVFIKELLEAGEVVPVIDRQYTLGESPEAIRYVEEGHARGKVIITI